MANAMPLQCCIDLHQEVLFAFQSHLFLCVVGGKVELVRYDGTIFSCGEEPGLKTDRALQQVCVGGEIPRSRPVIELDEMLGVLEVKITVEEGAAKVPGLLVFLEVGSEFLPNELVALPGVQFRPGRDSRSWTS